ncbi:lipopolysaccharide assembly protein LapB [Zwartia sp.]|uniref:lipopolysaccharide assembly protein LapB n=1 Tax=Zwartia sp. TaxID=2978004 RepID=UPI002718D2B8|nr:lipopolysaccharide assembly protein LapB [Zwartia sp.]MDO9026146.1 lipopolysaccharide assembly protein LapB [Zwartia sp.]
MDFEAWWLIFLPLLFALGWMAARFDIKQMLSETRNLPDSYFRGLNFLLNEEPDRAIDAFVEVAKLDPETTELHFALGSLFRRRGEMERAIRVHQSLLFREDLPVAQRDHAQHELAQDYLKAGMLDRAEEAFAVLKDTAFALPALRALIRIYESEHDWPRAITAVETLRKLVSEPVPQLVHYYCEQAQAALAEKPANVEQARAALKLAERALEQSQPIGGSHAFVRVSMINAGIAASAHDLSGQQRYLESVLLQAPEFAGLVATELFNCYSAQGQANAGLARLHEHYLQHPSLDLFNVVFRALRTQEGVEQAWTFARQALQSHPSLLGLDRLLEAELAQHPQGHSLEESPIPGADLTLLRRLINRHTQRMDRYICSACGFQARRYYWQCPGCNAWETYKPRRLEELE